MSRCGLATFVAALFLGATCGAQTTRIDSVHVFRDLPEAEYTSASATTMAWKLHHAKAAFATVNGTALDEVNRSLAQRKHYRHITRKLPTLAYLGMAFSNGGIQVVGLTGDMDLIVNFTARREFRLDDWSDRMKVRAMVAALMW